MSATVTICPPSTSSRYTNRGLDPYQFADPIRLQRPVSVRYRGNGEWDATGLDFGAYNFMQTSKRKQSGERRLATPEWAMNDSLLAAVVIRYLELRANLLRQQPGDLTERLTRVSERLKKQTERQLAVIDKLCSEYVACADPSRRNLLMTEIQNLDTTVRVDREPWVIPVIVKAYYRECCDSVGCGERVGFSSPHVRQILYRLGTVAKRMAAGTDARTFKCDQRRAAEAKTKKLIAPAVTVAPLVGTTFGVSVEAALDSGFGNPQYDRYVRFCERLNQQPMPFGRWALTS